MHVEAPDIQTESERVVIINILKLDTDLASGTNVTAGDVTAIPHLTASAGISGTLA